MSQQGKLAILVGGGPAPGINSVIGAATIRAELEGVAVVGIRDGFEWIMQGDTDHVVELTAQGVEPHPLPRRFHPRDLPRQPNEGPCTPRADGRVARAAGVSQLVTIGGDDTAYSAMRLCRAAAGRIRVAHTPKTIDNDLDLPPWVDTFGFQTARHYGVEIVQNLMVDAQTTSRWYFVIAMGRKAGHLALGMGKAAGATLTLIPEEFGETIGLSRIVDTLVGAIIKRLRFGHRDGVAVIAEGVVLGLDPDELAELDDVEHDAHGHLRIGEVDIGQILKARVQERLGALGVKASIVAKNVGYELRCADPIPADMEYTRDLGYCAAKYLLSGGSGVMVTMQAGQFVPVPFDTMLDAETGRTKVRVVDLHSTRYAIARRYMLRLRRDDFDDPDEIARLAGGREDDGRRLTAHAFEPLVADEPPALVLNTVGPNDESSGR